MNILDGTDTEEEFRLGLTPDEFADLVMALRQGGPYLLDSTAAKILRLAECVELGREMRGDA